MKWQEDSQVEDKSRLPATEHDTNVNDAGMMSKSSVRGWESDSHWFTQ